MDDNIIPMPDLKQRQLAIDRAVIKARYRRITLLLEELQKLAQSEDTGDKET